MVDDMDIYKYCIGEFKIGKPMNSPLRATDNNPSFAIFPSRTGGLLYKDHGTGDCGNAIKFLKEFKGIKTRDELEREFLRIVRRMSPVAKARVNTYDSKPKTYETDIGIVRQPFTAADKAYWKQFHISIATLKRFNVFSIKYFLCNNTVRGIYKDDNPMYAYKVYDKFKIYRPLASKYTKWRTNLTNRHIQGLAELPKEGGNLLIITKSLKDVMCFYEMGYYAIAAASETVFIPDDILQSLRSKWKHILILYDRDITGMLKSRTYSKKYKLDAFFIHKKFKSKDLSDAVKNNSYSAVKLWIDKMLEEYD